MQLIRLVVLLGVGLAFAQGNTGQSTTGVSRGNGLRVSDYRSSGTAALSYFVDAALGNDANTCTASGASACLTIQGATNKIPKLLRDGVTVSIAAGNYAGFLVSGFQFDYGFQQANSGILFDGTLANSTLATGVASGTATGGTVGADETFGTLVDSGATWTVNDLTGRLLTTSNTSVAVVIESNTSTTITIVGTAVVGWAAPVPGVTTYAVQDSATVITSGATLPAIPLLNSVTNRAGILALDNATNARNGAITFRNIKVANPVGNGVELGNGSYQLVAMQVRPTSATATGIRGSEGFATVSPMLVINNSDVFLSASSGSAILWSGVNTPTSFGGYFRGTATGAYGVNAAAAALQYCEISGFTHGFLVQNPAGSILSASRVVCGSSSGSYAMAVGQSPTAPFQDPTGVRATANGGNVDHLNVSVCNTAIYITGMSQMVLHGIRGSVGAVGVQITNGAFVSVNNVNLLAGFTAPVQLSLDNGKLTADFADTALGVCLTVPGSGSRACGL